MADQPENVAFAIGEIRGLSAMNVRPNLSVFNRANLCGAYAKPLGQIDALFARASNVARIICGQFNDVAKWPFPPVTTPARFSIGSVVKLRSPPKMRRVHARRVIAAVESSMLRGWSVDTGCQQGYLVRLVVSFAKAEKAISLSSLGFSPRPAMFRSADINIRPKSNDVISGKHIYSRNTHCAVPLHIGQGRAVFDALLRPAFYTGKSKKCQEETRIPMTIGYFL